MLLKCLIIVNQIEVICLLWAISQVIVNWTEVSKLFMLQCIMGNHKYHRMLFLCCRCLDCNLFSGAFSSMHLYMFFSAKNCPQALAQKKRWNLGFSKALRNVTRNLPASNVTVKGIVHPPKKIFVIIYSPSCCSKPVWISLLCWT